MGTIVLTYKFFMMTRDISAYLTEQQSKSTGDLAQEWGEIEDLYNKKLWHQLTLKLLAFVKHPSFATGDGLIQLYENFLADFEHRINSLSLAEIILHVIRQMKDAKEALEFVDKIKEKVKTSDEANILCMTAMGNIHLQQRDMDATKTILAEAQTLLDTIDGVTPVHGRFYELASNYQKLAGNHANYYRDALRFLGCIQLEEIPSAEQEERAFNLGLAAILGKGVYNFGELLAHPILQVLRTSQKQWLVDLLYAFNAGNIPKFDELKQHWQNQPDLASREIAMRQKIALLCLMEMTFKRAATDRQLTFTEIAKETRLPVEEVELLTMKALSLGLVRGSIDQIEQTVHMTWVQPRVLDREQIGTMVQRLAAWSVDVKSMEMLIENKATDILT